MTAHLKIGGSPVEIDNCLIKVGGSPVQVDAIYIKVGGSPELVWQNVVYDLSDIGSYSDTGAATQTYSVTLFFRATNDATVDVVRNVNGNTNNVEQYVDPADGPNLWIRCTDESGTPLNVGDATGSWHSLTSAQQRSFGLSYTSTGGVDFQVSSISFDLATDSGGSNIVASSGTISLTAGETS